MVLQQPNQSAISLSIFPDRSHQFSRNTDLVFHFNTNQLYFANENVMLMQRQKNTKQKEHFREASLTQIKRVNSKPTESTTGSILSFAKNDLYSVT